MRDSTLTKLIVATVALTLVGSAVAVGGAMPSHTDDTASQDTSYLRVAHVSPDAPAVNVSLDNETVLSDVGFGTVSDYLAVTAGTANVSISVADSPNVTVFAGNVTLDARTATTLYASGEVNPDANTSFEPVAVEDNAFDPGENQSALSIVHMSPDAGAVDVVVTEAPSDGEATPTETATPTGTDVIETPEDVNETEGMENETDEIVLADNVTFQNATDYVNVPAGDYTVELRAATETNDGEVVATVDLSVESGQAYSAIAAGYANPDAAPPEGEGFTVIAVQDVTTSITLPGEATPTPAPTTPVPTETPNETDTPEETPTETDTATPEDTPTETDTVTPEETPTETDTATPEGTPTGTDTATPEETPTGTDTATPEGTPAGTPTPTETPV